jgi:enterochelin esterase family protein
MSPTSPTIQRAKEFGNPVIRGDRATFIWEGKTAPHLISDLNGWEENPKPFKRLSSTPSTPLRTSIEPALPKSIWSASLTLPRDAYLEYALYDPVSQKRFTDPLNSKSISNGLGSRNNFFYMPETMPSPFTLRRADVPNGAITSHRVETGYLREDGEREIFLYRPPVKEPVPLLVVFDGQDYLQRGKLNTIVDNLIADKRIRPIAMAFLTNGGRWRNVEYFCSDATLHWLEKVVLPLAREQLHLLDITQHPGAYCVLGTSAGGAAALYAGLRMPNYFGNVLTQSSVSAVDGMEFSTVDLIRYQQSREIKVWMDVGALDFLLEDNRRMKSLMEERGYNIAYREFSGGHNYTAWRDDVWHGLEALFPLVES